MSEPMIRAVTGTASDDAVTGPADLWGIAVSGSISTTAIIRVYDNISFSAGTVVLQLQTNAINGGAVSTFERHAKFMLDRPIRCSRAVSIAADAGVERYWIYLGGGENA